MVKYSMDITIILGAIVGLVLLYVLKVDWIIVMIVIGFIATILTIADDRSYKVGGFSAGAIGVVLYMFTIFVPRPVDYSYSQIPSDLAGGFVIAGITNLIFGFIIAVGGCALFGFIGGYIADNLFKKRKVEGRSKNFNKEYGRKQI
ncbi:MAG: hypothetical protein FJ150_00765 [Euryarchaeota archaeon]|nr:hypothetical protein [Euryarchaeota archaeon]